MILKNLNKLFLIAIICTHTFAGSFGKSHSAELLSRGRSVPIAMFDDTLVAAKTFSSLTSRILDIYSYDSALNQLVKESEMISPNPMPGDDFGQKVDLTSRIREILVNYPAGTTVLKEFVQNADDGGAGVAADHGDLDRVHVQALVLGDEGAARVTAAFRLPLPAPRTGNAAPPVPLRCPHRSHCQVPRSLYRHVKG